MEKLVIEKTIKITAPASKVWKVITEKGFTDQWTNEFSAGMHLDSDWWLGSPVHWKSSEGNVVVEGDVTAVKPEKFLRYTVFDVKMGRFAASQTDGITFELSENDNETTLRILHGDFAVIKDGQRYYAMSIEPWNRILPKVKELAEQGVV